jgi:hypothetical protein
METLINKYPTVNSYRAFLISNGWPVSLTYSEWHKEWWENVVIPSCNQN